MSTVMIILLALVGGWMLGLWVGGRGCGLYTLLWGKWMGVALLAASLGYFLYRQGMVPQLAVLLIPAGMLISAIGSVWRLSRS